MSINLNCAKLARTQFPNARVPPMYPSSEILAILPILPNREISKLRALNTHRDFESLSLRQSSSRSSSRVANL